MTRDEAAQWLRAAGVALGEAERYWFGSLYDLGYDFADIVRRRGGLELSKYADTIAREDKARRGPHCRALCLFARHVGRAVT